MRASSAMSKMSKTTKSAVLDTSTFQSAPSHRMQISTRYAGVIRGKVADWAVTGGTLGIGVGRFTCGYSDAPEGSRWSLLERVR